MKINQMKHIMYCPDGSRRYAIKTGKEFATSYEEMAKNLIETIEIVFDYNQVEDLSIWALQEYHLDRDPEQLKGLIKAAVNWILAIVESKTVKDKQLQVKIIGEIESFYKKYPEARNIIAKALEKVKNHKGKTINVLIAYNGSKELNRAIERCKQKNIEVSFKNLSSNWSMPAIDLFIKTGRPSNFNESSDYFPGMEMAKLVSTETYPQELKKEELKEIIEKYLTLKDSYNYL